MKDDANDLGRKPTCDWKDLGTVNASLQDFNVIGASSYDSLTSEFERFTDQSVRLQSTEALRQRNAQAESNLDEVMK